MLATCLQAMVMVAQASSAPAEQQGPNMMRWLIGGLLVLVVLMLFSGRSKRKEQQTREKMLAGLSRNDRVVTLGGMVGVVTDVRDDEVTVKVDEGTNTRIRMKKWAIRALEAQEGESQSQKK